MTWEIAFVLGLTVCAVVLFVTEKFSTDIVAILVMIVLLVFRVLTPAEGLAGFANTATVTVGATRGARCRDVHLRGPRSCARSAYEKSLV